MNLQGVETNYSIVSNSANTHQSGKRAENQFICPLNSFKSELSLPKLQVK